MRHIGCTRPVYLAMLALGSAAIGRADFMLTITPTFGASITGDPNAVAIENTINSAISYYNSTFTTHFGPVNVSILFNEGGGLGSSTTGIYKQSYTNESTALTNASSGDSTDTTALAHLPVQANNPVTGSTNINVSSANGRALGFNTPGIVNGTFDGAISLNTSLTTPGSPGSALQYSLLSVTEHEIDEVLGLGSDVGGAGFFADPRMQDLFRYTAAGARTYTTAGDNAWFSLDGSTDIVQFNQSGGGADYGDWHTSATPRVQDAFGTPGATATLANDGGAEVINLDAIGYNLTAPVPEPTAFALFGTVLAGVGLLRRRNRSSKPQA